MALAVSPVYNINVSMVDRDKNVSSMGFHSSSTQLIGVLQAAVVDYLIPAIEGISNAVVKSWSITLAAVDDGAAATAPEESDVERKGVFSFRAEDGSAYVVSVPSIKNTLVIDDTNIINRADALVVAFTNAVATPVLLDLSTLRTYLGADIVSSEKAVKHHRGSSRG